MNLEELFVKYGTDKGGPNGWGYTPHYMWELANRRERVKRVLEIGICGNRNIPNNRTGASLFCWQEFFPNAEVIGLDNEKAWMVNQGRIKSYCVNAYDTQALLALPLGDNFDFICDDAVHDPDVQIKLFNSLIGKLAPDGLYAIEDVCPYKLPEGNMQHMTSQFRAPRDLQVQVHKTHKEERLVFVKFA